MGKDCCSAKEEALVQLGAGQSRVLKIVLVLNASMFVVEFVSGLLAGSTALLADSLDMFGDAVVYGFSLFVLNKSLRWRSGAALLKGIIMLIFGIGVLGEVGYKISQDAFPEPATMGVVGSLALAVNLLCLLLLSRHREDDINMRSTWICSRNDIIANCGVLLASAAVAIMHNKWPDVAIGLIIAVIFLKSAVQVMLEAAAGLRNNNGRAL